MNKKHLLSIFYQFCFHCTRFYYISTSFFVYVHVHKAYKEENQDKITIQIEKLNFLLFISKKARNDFKMKEIIVFYLYIYMTL